MFDQDKAASAATADQAVSVVQRADQGTLSAMTREAVEAKGMVEAAKAYPRNETAAFAALDRAVSRVSLAEKAQYRFPRGGETVSGPTVVLAREAARCWGNITHGLRIVEETDDRVHIQGWAWDLETNTRAVHEDKFAKRIQRKRGGVTVWVEPDERDLRELVNRRGAMLVRNALLEVIPRDLVDEAVLSAQAALKADSADKLKKGRGDAVKEVVRAFKQYHVDVAMLEAYLGHPMASMDEDELTTLRGIYTSLRDGNTKRGDHFKVAGEKAGDAAAATATATILAETEGGDDAPAEEGSTVALKPCKKCKGSGGPPDDPCDSCLGSGEVPA